MKIRSDFVTNSSSSSYIIAYKAIPEIDEETRIKYPFLKNYSKLVEKVLFTEGDNDTTAGAVSKTKDEWGEINEDEVDDHYVSVTSQLDGLKGFDFNIESGSGRNG